MPSTLEDHYNEPPHIHVDGHTLTNDHDHETHPYTYTYTYTKPDYRRESSSSRSTSAMISTPLASSENLHEMVRVASLDDTATVADKVVSSRSTRRIGEQERTKSWAQTQVQDQVGDEDRLLKPPSQEPTRRPVQIALEQPAELEPSSRRTSKSSCDFTTYKLARKVRRTSSALSASINSTTSGSESDPTNLSPAELGARIMARERDQREKRFKIKERKAAAQKKESIIEPPEEESEVVVKPVEKPKEAIVSIAELINRHKEAMAKPTIAVKDRARKELGIALAKPPSSVTSTRSSKKSSDTPLARRRGETPTIPARTSSTPDAVVGIVPPRTSSMTDIVNLTLARTISDNRSTTTGTTGTESVTRDALLAQAALEQLELDDRPVSRCSRQVSFQETRSPSRLRKERPSMTPSRESLASTSIKEDEEQEALAVALYLRSPNLNRYFSFPRQAPDPPLRVSVAEVGALTGAPVLLFLGLGCVRYLTALFDDLAKALDLRLICIDRWGYGKTDMVDESKRGLREWAAIVERVMDEMKIRQFSVLAHSAGCPYALAAANRMKERVVGKIHLLAPWVGTDVDNSYKWLKWVPNGIIKSATAAEWKLQSYFLGKPPPLTYSPIGYTAQPTSSSTYLPLPLGSARNASMLSLAGTRKPSLLHRASSIVLRTKSNNLNIIAEPEYVNLAELTEVQSGILPMRPLPAGKPKNWKGIGHDIPKVDKKDLSRLQPPGSNIHDPWKSPSRNSSSSSLNQIPSASNPNTPRPLDFGLSEGFDRFPSDLIPKPLGSTNSPIPAPTPKKKGFTAYSYSYSYSYSRSPNASSSKQPSRPDSPSRPSGPSFGVALQQASHAECEPGTTSDLLSIVLGRQHANRPWQYALNYADFSLPVKIYWGQDDDKISEKSVRWMEKTMMAGAELLVLEGEGHNLMTSSGVMLSVFQSLREEVTAASLGPQPDLRLY